MKSMKTVLLGSAAAIVATGAAQAADLPVKKAAAVQYVEVCPAFGKGFYKLPGTDICLRHTGSVKFNFAYQDTRRFVDETGALTVIEDNANTTGWELTVRPAWDFRSPTEFGTLRTFVQARWDQENGNYAGPTPSLTGGSLPTLHRAYIEWAGFLVGRASSQYIYWDQDDVVNAIGGSPKQTAMQLTYVWALPGGMKATIGLEDTGNWVGGGISDLTGATIPGSVSVGGPQRMYDVVATLSTEQAWGNAKIAGLLHQVTSNNGSTVGTRHEIDTGWAILGGITFKLPMLGANDQLLLEATYSDGAIAASGLQGGASNTLTQFAESGQYLDGLQYGSFDAFAVLNADATGWNLETTKVWGIAGQLRHYWAPLWRSNFMASYQRVDTPDIACVGGTAAPAALTLANGFRCDARAWDIGANLIWGKSRDTLEIGVEAIYKSVRQDIPAATVLPEGTDQNPNGWIFAAFVQRAW